MWVTQIRVYAAKAISTANSYPLVLGKSRIYSVYLDCYYEGVASAYCNVTMPEKGQTPDYTTVSSAPYQYTAEVVQWLRRGRTDTVMSPTDTFAAGGTYVARVKFTAKPGYYLGSRTKFFINRTEYSYNSEEIYERVFTAPDDRIHFADCLVTEPSPGKYPSMTATSGDSQKYTVELKNWYLVENGSETLMTSTDSFAPGKTYAVTATYTAVDDWQLTEDTVYTINGQATTSNGRGQYKTTFTTPAPTISNASCSVIEPVGGFKLNYYQHYDQATCDSERYTVSGVEWFIYEGREMTALGANDVYTAGKTYIARVKFTANDGYMFTDNTVFKINGKAAEKVDIRGVIYWQVRFVPEQRFAIGDANGDGVVNIKDVTTIQRHVAEFEILTGAELRAADFNWDLDDMIIDIEDATWMQVYLAGFWGDYEAHYHS